MAGLDLRTHETLVEHTDGRQARIALTPHRPVPAVTREVLVAVERLVGAVEINPTPQEAPWTVPLDEDREHATYEPAQVTTYFTAATQAARVLAEFGAPSVDEQRPSTRGGGPSIWRSPSSRDSQPIHRPMASSSGTWRMWSRS